MKILDAYIKFFITIACSVFIAGATADNKLITPISVINAVVYVPLGKASTTVAFFTIKNNSDKDVVITGVSSPAVKKISLIPLLTQNKSAIPLSSEKKDVSSNPWIIAAGQSLTLTPEHQYLQLNGLKDTLVTGDELQLIVALNNGKTLTVLARAKSAFDQIHGH